MSRDPYSFWISFRYKWYKCAKFHHCMIYATDFRQGGSFCPPHPWAAPKKPILNRVKEHLLNNTAPLGDCFWYILSLFEKTAWKFKRRLKRNNRIDNIDNNINVISSIIFRWLCQTLTPEYFQQLNTCLFSNLSLISNDIKVCSHHNALF